MREEAYIPDPSKTQDFVNKISQILKEENYKGIWFFCPETRISEKEFGGVVRLCHNESMWEKLNWDKLTKVVDRLLFSIPEIKAVTIQTRNAWWCAYKKPKKKRIKGGSNGH